MKRTLEQVWEEFEISSRAHDLVATAGAGHDLKAIAEEQAERIAELEHFLAQEKKIAEKDHGIWCDNYAALERKYKTARNDALREAAEIAEAATQHHALCDHYCHDDCPTRTDVSSTILALIEGDTND